MRYGHRMRTPTIAQRLDALEVRVLATENLLIEAIRHLALAEPDAMDVLLRRVRLSVQAYGLGQAQSPTIENETDLLAATRLLQLLETALDRER